VSHTKPGRRHDAVPEAAGKFTGPVTCSPSCVVLTRTLAGGQAALQCQPDPILNDSDVALAASGATRCQEQIMNNNRGRNLHFDDRNGRGRNDGRDQQGWQGRGGDMGRGGNNRYDYDDDQRFGAGRGDRDQYDNDYRFSRGGQGRGGWGGNGDWQGESYRDRGRSGQNFPGGRGGSWQENDNDRSYSSNRFYGDENLRHRGGELGGGYQGGDRNYGSDYDRDEGNRGDYDRGYQSREDRPYNEGGYRDQGSYGRGQGTSMSSRGDYGSQDDDYEGGYRGRGGYNVDDEREGRRWGSPRQDNSRYDR
jgi:hypothetical protein